MVDSVLQYGIRQADQCWSRFTLRLSGRSLDQIRIEFSGLRPGEKLYEELLADQDMTLPTASKALRIARLTDSEDARRVVGWLQDTLTQAAEGDDAALRGRIKGMVGEYRAGGAG